MSQDKEKSNKKLIIGIIIGIIVIVLFLILRQRGDNREYPDISTDSIPENELVEQEQQSETQETIGSLDLPTTDWGRSGEYTGDDNLVLYQPEEMEFEYEGVTFTRQNLYPLGLSALIPNGYELVPNQSGDFVTFYDPESTQYEVPHQISFARYQSDLKAKNHIANTAEELILNQLKIYYPNDGYMMTQRLNQNDPERYESVYNGEVEVYLDQSNPRDYYQMISPEYSRDGGTKALKLERWTDRIFNKSTVNEFGEANHLELQYYLNYGVLERDATLMVMPTTLYAGLDEIIINDIAAESIALMFEENTPVPNMIEPFQLGNVAFNLPQSSTVEQEREYMQRFKFTEEGNHPLNSMQFISYQSQTAPNVDSEFNLYESRMFLEEVSPLIIGNAGSGGSHNDISFAVGETLYQDENDTRTLQVDAVTIDKGSNISAEFVTNVQLPAYSKMLTIYQKDSGIIHSFIIMGSQNTSEFQNNFIEQLSQTLIIN